MTKNKKILKGKPYKQEAIFGVTVALIPLIGFLIFSMFPLILSFVTMFADMKGYSLETMAWNSFANFKDTFKDELFWLSLRNTFVLLLTQFISLIIALLTSVLLAEKFAGSKFFTTVFFIPHICSSVAISIMWMTMFNNDYGIINTVLTKLLGDGAHVQWFNTPIPFFMMIFIIILWRSPGYGIVMFNSAITAVPRSLYEAAEVDGANKLRCFWNITLPSIRSTSFFLIMAGIINGMQQFEIPQVISSVLGNSWTGEAGPNNMGLTTMVYIYNTGISFNNMPKAAVMSFVLFFITMIASIVNFKARRATNE